MMGGLLTKKRVMIFQLLAIVYGLFYLAYLLTSPTSATFHDTKRIDVTLSAANEFEDQQKQTESDHTDQKLDKENSNQERGQDKGTNIEDNGHLSEDTVRQKTAETEEASNATSNPETSDHTEEMSSGVEEERPSKMTDEADNPS